MNRLQDWSRAGPFFRSGTDDAPSYEPLWGKDKTLPLRPRRSISPAKKGHGLLWLGLVVVVVILTLTSFASTVLAAGNANETCLECHDQSRADPRFKTPAVKGDLFQASVHSKLPCLACHPITEGGYPHGNMPRGKTMPAVANAECATCHKKEATAFAESIHGAGPKPVATCTTCHQPIHELQKTAQPVTAQVKTAINSLCLNCHQGKVAESYRYSFHGLALRLGDAGTAGCVDCHGAHKILPASNAASTVAPGNLAKSCESCHPGAPAGFANGREHALPSDRSYLPVWIVYKLFLLLILFDITKDFGIILLDLRHRWLSLGQAGRHEAKGTSS